MTLAPLKIIIISMDPNFLNEFMPYLEKEFSVQRVTSPEQTYFLTSEWEPDLAFIDTDSPFAKMTKSLYQKNQQIGLFTFSRSVDLKKEAEAFHSGADHFLTIPIDYQSLYLRVRNWSLKRPLPKALPSHEGSALVHLPKAPEDQSAILFRGIRIYPHDFLIKYESRVVNVTPTQFKLLLAFVSHKDQLLSREWIRESVWDGSRISPRSIDAQISKLKKLLPDLEPHLVNIYGKGYMLTQPQEDAA